MAHFEILDGDVELGTQKLGKITEAISILETLRQIDVRLTQLTPNQDQKDAVTELLEHARYLIKMGDNTQATTFSATAGQMVNDLRPRPTETDRYAQAADQNATGEATSPPYEIATEVQADLQERKPTIGLRERLLTFAPALGWVGYVLSLALLWFAGMFIIYRPNATFGSQGIMDYIAAGVTAFGWALTGENVSNTVRQFLSGQRPSAAP